MEIVRNAGWVRLTLLGLALALPGACTPSVPNLKKMRGETRPRTARNHQALLLRRFESKKMPAAWRAEAMTTMAAVDARFRYATSDPESHKRLLRLLRREYRTPGVASDEDPGNVHRLRAWSLYTLGRVDRPNDLVLLLEALRRHKDSNDPKYRIRTAARDSLSPQIPMLRAEPALRWPRSRQR